MQKIITPICIVGGGPAGLLASLNLSKHKIHHVLVDKFVFPRDKVCGENFDGRVKHVFNRVVPGFFDELENKGVVQFTHEFSIHLTKGVVPIRYNPESTPRILAKRIDFDAALMQKVKESGFAEVIESELIQDFYYEDEGIVFFTKNLEVKASLGLVACGYQSGLIKNRKLEKHTYFFSRAYYKNISLIHPVRTIETYYFEKPYRCCLLICPIPNGEFNVEVGIKKEDYLQLKIRMEDLLDYFIQNHPELQQRFHNAICIQKPKGVHLPITTQHKIFTDKNIIYIGASSFCVNPITGMGVGNAMVMAEEASNVAVDCVTQNDFSDKKLRVYEKAIRKRLRNPLIANYVVNLFFRHLNITAPVLLLLIRTKLIVNLLNKQDFLKNLLNPLYYFKTLVKPK
jgi:flavin-dependent dehydrogenase